MSESFFEEKSGPFQAERDVIIEGSNRGKRDRLVIPRGASVGSIALDGSQLAVKAIVPKGTLIILYDLNKKHVTSILPIHQEGDSAA